MVCLNINKFIYNYEMYCRNLFKEIFGIFFNEFIGFVYSYMIKILLLNFSFKILRGILGIDEDG